MATICMMIKTVVDSEEGVNVGADCKPYLDLTMAAAKSNSSGNIDGCCDVPKEKILWVEVVLLEIFVAEVGEEYYVFMPRSVSEVFL